jgi:two-component system nitrogen regulation response regulator GlnG
VTAPRFVDTTRKRPPETSGHRTSHAPVVMLAHHPALVRVGATLALPRQPLALSRTGPAFSDGLPIDDPFVSRSPFTIRRAGDGVVIDGNGVELTRTGEVTGAELAAGVGIVVAGRVLLWLTTDHVDDADHLGLRGTSAGIHAVRDAIRAAAGANGPILVTGETGTGKELVARALHAAGPRAAGPLVAVNVAAIPAAVAAAELFGHDRGAFTGANERRAGYFERAAGGVLFLDEIGDLPESIQPLLLRALDQGEVQPVGGQPRQVDVAVIAATDADLATAVQRGTFRAPLYYRLAATAIELPPLRARRGDIPQLLAHFLRDQLPADLADATTNERAPIPAAVVAELCRAPWPGNVRQLRAVAHRLVAIARAGKVATLDDLGIEAAPDDAGEPIEPLDDDRLVATLRGHGFHLARTAEALGVSRTHLDALIARSGRVRKAKSLDRDEIAAVAAELDDDIDAMAARLEVSPRGLRLRMRQLGLV